MTARANYENFLAREGRSLADGGRGQLTPEEWLYAYNEIMDDLAEAKAKVFARFAERIRNKIVDREMVAVAL